MCFFFCGSGYGLSVDQGADRMYAGYGSGGSWVRIWWIVGTDLKDLGYGRTHVRTIDTASLFCTGQFREGQLRHNCRQAVQTLVSPPAVCVLEEVLR